MKLELKKAKKALKNHSIKEINNYVLQLSLIENYSCYNYLYINTLTDNLNFFMYVVLSIVR